MKNIGIKLADGNFYPVLQDNVPSEKALTLTTVHNNQTKVTVDLYRFETDSTEEAEYVDSLQINNLKAHPNGEPNLSFTVSLDEENQLSAKIVDDETGLQSNTTITLVSRTIEERLHTDEYNIKDLEKPAEEKKSSLPKAGGLLAAASALLVNSDKEDSVPNTEDENFSTDDTIVADEPLIEDPIVVEPEEPTDEETIVDEPEIEQEPEVSSPLFTVDEEISNMDIDFTVPVSPTTMNDLDALELPDDNNLENHVNEDYSLETEFTTQNENTILETEETIAQNDDLDLNTNDTEFDLPDFDNTNLDDSTFADINIEDTPFEDNALDDSTFDIPDLDDTDFTDTTFGEETMNKNETTNSKGGISFTGLYDKETELGNSANSQNDVSKKTKAPVIICVICAIICLLVTAFLLFILPSKYNLLGKTGKCEENQTGLSLSYLEKTTQEEIPAMPEAIAETEAEEDIIIIEKAEEVIPEQPPVTTEKPKDISYKIKWGDTLWDISDTYYKNPWRYKYIARFNGIKDPDYIISGTYITIPAE